jgi:hypothetical protein
LAHPSCRSAVLPCRHEAADVKLGQHWWEEYVEDKLNAAGAEGWEAVGMGRLPVNELGGGEATVLLKRQATAP